MEEQQIKQIFVPNEPFLEEVEEYLKRGEKVFINVRGTSMLPFLEEGDKVLLVSGSKVTLRKGSVVLVRIRHNYILHRIIRMDENTLLLAGDANSKLTENVIYADIIGVMIEIYRNDYPLHINSFRNRMAVWIWIFIRPFRGYLLGAYHRLNKIRK